MGDAVTDEDGEYYNTKTNSEVNTRSGESSGEEVTVKIKSKKRVQFPPDGFLVRVREIPPRSHQYSSESDNSPEESSSESEDTESETESESSTEVDDSTDSDSPSPPPSADTTQPTFIAVKTATKPAPINPGTKTTSPNSAPVVPPVTRSPQHKVRSTFTVVKDSPTPLFVKSEKDKLNKLKTRTTFLSNSRKKPEINLPPSVFKTPKPVRTSTTNILHQRRAKSAPIGKSQPIKRNYQSSATTSLSVLPSTIQDEINSATESIQQTFQSISIGQLYTIDGFIFPSHQASELHLPKVIHATGSGVNTSPHTSSSDSPSALRQLHNKTFFSGNSGEPNSNNLALQQARQLNTKRRHYAWQMANGSAEQTLYKTPNIAQMWDSTSQTSAASSDLNKNNLF